MTKADLVDKIHAKAGLGTRPQPNSSSTRPSVCCPKPSPTANQVSFTGFGSFKVVERSERKGRNPRTGEECLIPASRVVKFTPGKALKEAVK